MKVKTILTWINRHAAIHVCIAAIFALCWLFHYVAFLTMEVRNRQFLLMNDETTRSMAIVDLVAAHRWLVVCCAFLVFTIVLFLQIRGQARWHYRLVAVAFCILCFAYVDVCAYITLKF